VTQPSGTTRPVRRLSAGLLAAALLLLTACGDDDGDAAAATPSETSAAPTSPSETAPSSGTATPSAAEEPAGGTLEVSSVDFGYELDSTELAAGEYTINLTNGGNASHDLVVERDGEEVDGTDVIGLGESSTVTVMLEPGEYVFYCSIANHRSMGMEVTVTVT
jgi:plastocyanin